MGAGVWASAETWCGAAAEEGRVSRSLWGSSITVDVDVSLDEFDEDDIVEYLQALGYYVGKKTEPQTYERYPEGVKTAQEYINEFCKLNGIAFVQYPAPKATP
jgi:hypothetical protein